MNFRANDNPGYWLFYAQRTVAHAFSEVLKQCCQEHEKPYVITPPQWGVLSQLYETDGLIIGGIGQRRGLDAPTITGIVKRLEDSGLVQRLHDREDRRVVKVYLTDEGHEIMRLLLASVEAFDKLVTRGFSEAEKNELQTKLQRIIFNVSSAAPHTGDRFGLLPQDFQQEEGECRYQ